MSDLKQQKREKLTSGMGALIGLIMGGAVGLLAGPAGVVVGGVLGALLGDAFEQGAIDAEDRKVAGETKEVRTNEAFRHRDS